MGWILVKFWTHHLSRSQFIEPHEVGERPLMLPKAAQSLFCNFWMEFFLQEQWSMSDLTTVPCTLIAPQLLISSQQAWTGDSVAPYVNGRMRLLLYRNEWPHPSWDPRQDRSCWKRDKLSHDTCLQSMWCQFISCNPIDQSFTWNCLFPNN